MQVKLDNKRLHHYKAQMITVCDEHGVSVDENN